MPAILLSLLGGAVSAALALCGLHWAVAGDDEMTAHPSCACLDCPAMPRWIHPCRCVGFWRRIDPRALAVIAAGGAVVWFVAASKNPSVLLAAFEGLFLSALLAIAVTDHATFTIPDPLSLGMVGVGLARVLLPDGPAFLDVVLGAGFGFGLLWLIRVLGTAVFREEAMGIGDLRMMAMIGAFLGWQGTILTLVVGSFFGTAVHLPRLRKARTKIPFGTCLAVGAGTTSLYGSELIGWYVNVVMPS